MDSDLLEVFRLTNFMIRLSFNESKILIKANVPKDAVWTLPKFSTARAVKLRTSIRYSQTC